MPHLLDTTNCWNAADGGVRRYLEAKKASARYVGWRHTIAASEAPECGGVVLPSMVLPGIGHHLSVRRREAARIIAACRPDLIESGDPYRLAWAALDAAQLRGVPAVALCHSNLELLARRLAGRQLGPSAARAARRYARHLYSQFDLVLAPSRALCAHLVNWGIERVGWQPMGVDTTLFHPWQRRTDWRRQLGLAKDTRLLIYAGRFTAEMNLHVLAEAVERLGAPYWLVAVGHGPAPPVGHRVTVLPTTFVGSGLAAMLASADAFVSASEEETSGVSVLEAMACGTPAVGPGAEGLAGLINDSNGVVVRGPTPTHFAQGIAALFDRHREGLARAARERAVAQDWHRVLPALWLRYDRLFSGHTISRRSPAKRPAPSA